MTVIRTTLCGVAAEAALAVPGVTGLQPRLSRRLAAAAAPTLTDAMLYHTPAPEAAIRADRAPGGSGWHIEVRCNLATGRRALDVAQNVHDRVGAAVISHLAALDAVERVTVEVTVTRIAAWHDGA